MRILRADGYRRMPWKNGGGETVEIAVFPEGAGLAGFDWRVSMARVDSDGPFSEFPGIDRTLAILKGAGIILDVEGDEPRRLTIGNAPHAFPADRPTSASLIGGTVIDFNVMSRRGKVVHEVRPFVGETSAPGDGLRLLLCTSDTLTAEVAGNAVSLGRLDALLAGPGDDLRVTGPADAAGFLVTVSAKS